MTDPADIRAQIERDMMAMTPEQMQARDLRMARDMQNAAHSYPQGDAARNLWPHDASPPEPEAPKSLLSRIAEWWRA